MLPVYFSIDANKKIDDFLWRQWSQLGLAGGADWNPNWIIDPERLLLFSLAFARLDARLFDEIIDWMTVNERWVSVQRLKALVLKTGQNDIVRTAHAVASFMDSKTTNNRWKALGRLKYATPEKEQSFFYRSNYLTIPTLGEAAKEFQTVGWTRSTIQVRGLSNPVDCDLTSNLIFRLRSLCGLNPRAEILAYLLTHDRATISELVNELRYAKPTIHEVINDLMIGRHIEQKKEMNRFVFTADKIRWFQFLGITVDKPVWLSWRAIYLALEKLGQFLLELETGHHSEYILQAKARQLVAQMRDELVGSGLPIPFTHPFDVNHIWTDFPVCVDQWLDSLNKASGDN